MPPTPKEGRAPKAALNHETLEFPEILFSHLSLHPDEIFRSLKFLNHPQKIELLEFALRHVLENRDLAHEKSVIQFRKRVAEKLSITKGNGNMMKAVEGAFDLPSSSIPFLKANPGKTRSFLGRVFRLYPAKGDMILSEIILELVRALPKPQIDQPPILI